MVVEYSGALMIPSTYRCSVKLLIIGRPAVAVCQLLLSVDTTLAEQ